MSRWIAFAGMVALISCGTAGADRQGTVRDQSWRHARPVASRAVGAAALRGFSFQLENGLTVHVFPAGSLPLVSVRVVIHGGAALAAPESAGLPHLVGELVASGGRTRPLGVAQEAESLGFGLSVETTFDYTALSLDGLVQNLPRALDLLADLVQRPRLEDGDVEKTKLNVAARLERNAYDAREVALATLRQVTFGVSHPYAYSPLGTRKALRELSRQDVALHYEAYWRPENASVVVVGQVSPDQVEELLRPRFGRWTGHGPKTLPREVARPAVTERPRCVVIDVPEAPQTILAAAGPAIETGGVDWVATDVMNRIVGGSYASRLNLTLREEKGYTYAARSRVERSRHAGFFVALAPVTVDKTGPALEDFWNIVGRAASQPPTPDEMEEARATARSGLLNEIETTRGRAGALARVLGLRQPLDWHSFAIEQAAKVTPEEVVHAARQFIDPARLTWVLVGPAKLIKAEASRLGLGEPEVLPFTAF